MGVKRIITPSSEALKSNSLRMAPDLSEVVMNRMPKVSDWWIFAWPISRMNASYRARISVSEEVMPGLVFARNIDLDYLYLTFHSKIR